MPWSTPNKSEAVRAAFTLTAVCPDKYTFEVVNAGYVNDPNNFWRVVVCHPNPNLSYYASFNADGTWDEDTRMDLWDNTTFHLVQPDITLE